MRTPARRAPGGWIGRAVLAVVGLAMATLALEIGLRVLYPDVPIIRRDERVGSLARPNLDVRKTFGGHERVVRVATNAFGLRGAEVPTGKTPGLRRVLALGDSFTFGDAVEAEEAWPAQLERLLNGGASPGRWHVVNAGIPGHGTGQQLLLSRLLEERVRPDVVVLGFTVVNDVLDNLCVEEASYTPKRGVPCFVLDGQRLALVTPPRIEPAPARRARLRVVDFVAGEARRLTLGHPRLLALAGWSGVAADLPYVPATIASWYDPRYAEPGWRLTRRLLTELREQFHAQRVPLVVLVIPAALQVDPGLQSALRAFGARHAAVQDFLGEPARPQRLVADFCRSAALDCVDALPALQELGERGTRTYYSIDNHWTPAAHARAADLVAHRLADRGPADIRVGIAR
jgi:GDSL-like lipase/acylhydrolase family protein